MNLVLYVVSGVFQPLFIMEMDYAGVGKQLGLLYMLPYYVGMACVLPFATQPLRLFMPGSVPWRKVCVITGVDVRAESRSPRPSSAPYHPPPPPPSPSPPPPPLHHRRPPPQFVSQWILLTGLTVIGSGLFTVIYASGPVWTALLAYVILKRRISSVQKLALVVVMTGLAVVTWGSWQLTEIDDSFAFGLALAMVGTILHALVYVLQERTNHACIHRADDEYQRVPRVRW